MAKQMTVEEVAKAMKTTVHGLCCKAAEHEPNPSLVATWMEEAVDHGAIPGLIKTLCDTYSTSAQSDRTPETEV